MHRNTRLTPYSRERMLQEYQQGMRIVALVERYGISRTSFYRWLRRFQALGKEGLKNRTSRPYRIHYRLRPDQEDELVQLRHLRRWGPARLAPLLGAPSNTLYRCLRRHGLGRLPKPPQPAVVRYEVAAPGGIGPSRRAAPFRS